MTHDELVYEQGMAVPLSSRWSYISEEWAAKERIWEGRISHPKPKMSRQEYLETVSKKKKHLREYMLVDRVVVAPAEGRRLETLKLQAGLTWGQLADIAGVAKGTSVADWIRGAVHAPVEGLRLVREHLEMVNGVVA